MFVAHNLKSEIRTYRRIQVYFNKEGVLTFWERKLYTIIYARMQCNIKWSHCNIKWSHRDIKWSHIQQKKKKKTKKKKKKTKKQKNTGIFYVPLSTLIFN